MKTNPPVSHPPCPHCHSADFVSASWLNPDRGSHYCESCARYFDAAPADVVASGPSGPLTLAQKVKEHAALARAAAPRARRKKADCITVMLYGESTYWKPDGVTPLEAAPTKVWSVQLRVFDLAGESDQVLEELPPPLSAFAERMLKALRLLSKENEPHPCGGFTTDDMQWRMGTAFTSEKLLASALEELETARLIRYAGYDEEDAIGTCYALREESEVGR